MSGQALAWAIFCAIGIGIGTSAETHHSGCGMLAALVCGFVIACVHGICEVIKTRTSSDKGLTK